MISHPWKAISQILVKWKTCLCILWPSTSMAVCLPWRKELSCMCTLTHVLECSLHHSYMIHQDSDPRMTIHDIDRDTWSLLYTLLYFKTGMVKNVPKMLWFFFLVYSQFTLQTACDCVCVKEKNWPSSCWGTNNKRRLIYSVNNL